MSIDYEEKVLDEIHKDERIFKDKFFEDPRELSYKISPILSKFGRQFELRTCIVLIFAVDCEIFLSFFHGLFKFKVFDPDFLQVFIHNEFLSLFFFNLSF